jgi:pimeloyl-ACP methyl ester carboxylesterase
MQNLLLLHGALGAKSQLKPVSETLSNKFKVHLMNFSGHGGNKMPENFSINGFAKDVIAYLDKNKIDTIKIFGYSMGGYVALYLAKHHPDRVDRVFTLATKFLWTPETAAKELKMLDAKKIEEKVPSFAVTLQERHLPNDWKTVLKRTAEMMKEMGKKNPMELKDFADIEQHVLIGIGDKDTMVGMEETIEVYRQLKHARLIVFPDTEHPIEKVDLDRLEAEIKNFFLQ